MTTKTLEEVKELAKGYDLVPIQEEIFADLVYICSLEHEGRCVEECLLG